MARSMTRGAVSRWWCGSGSLLSCRRSIQMRRSARFAEREHSDPSALSRRFWSVGTQAGGLDGGGPARADWSIPVVAAAVVPECENLDPRTLERTRRGASQSELGYDDSGGRLTPGKWGVAYGPTSVGRILRGLGLSRQKARPSHPKKDAAAAEAFFACPI